MQSNTLDKSICPLCRGRGTWGEEEIQIRSGDESSKKQKICIVCGEVGANLVPIDPGMFDLREDEFTLPEFRESITIVKGEPRPQIFKGIIDALRDMSTLSREDLTIPAYITSTYSYSYFKYKKVHSGKGSLWEILLKPENDKIDKTISIRVLTINSEGLRESDSYPLRDGVEDPEDYLLSKRSFVVGSSYRCNSIVCPEMTLYESIRLFDAGNFEIKGITNLWAGANSFHLLRHNGNSTSLLLRFKEPIPYVGTAVHMHVYNESIPKSEPYYNNMRKISPSTRETLKSLCCTSMSILLKYTYCMLPSSLSRVLSSSCFITFSDYVPSNSSVLLQEDNCLRVGMGSDGPSFLVMSDADVYLCCPSPTLRSKGRKGRKNRTNVDKTSNIPAYRKIFHISREFNGTDFGPQGIVVCNIVFYDGENKTKWNSRRCGEFTIKIIAIEYIRCTISFPSNLVPSTRPHVEDTSRISEYYRTTTLRKRTAEISMYFNSLVKGYGSEGRNERDYRYVREIGSMVPYYFAIQREIYVETDEDMFAYYVGRDSGSGGRGASKGEPMLKYPAKIILDEVLKLSTLDNIITESYLEMRGIIEGIETRRKIENAVRDPLLPEDISKLDFIIREWIPELLNTLEGSEGSRRQRVISTIHKMAEDKLSKDAEFGTSADEFWKKVDPNTMEVDELISEGEDIEELLGPVEELSRGLRESREYIRPTSRNVLIFENVFKSSVGGAFYKRMISECKRKNIDFVVCCNSAETLGLEEEYYRGLAGGYAITEGGGDYYGADYDEDDYEIDEITSTYYGTDNRSTYGSYHGDAEERSSVTSHELIFRREGKEYSNVDDYRSDYESLGREEKSSEYPVYPEYSLGEEPAIVSSVESIEILKLLFSSPSLHELNSRVIMAQMTVRDVCVALGSNSGSSASKIKMNILNINSTTPYIGFSTVRSFAYISDISADELRNSSPIGNSMKKSLHSGGYRDLTTCFREAPYIWRTSVLSTLGISLYVQKEVVEDMRSKV